MKLANNLSRLGTETAFEVLARAATLEREGKEIINLGIGQPDFKTPEHIVEAAVKALGKQLSMTEEAGTFFSVSLGQGQEPVAEKALDRMHALGGWVMLQNIELVARWLPKLEKKLEGLIEGAHEDFRVFLSALPQKVVPVGVLQNSIKLTNEPPTGLKANLKRAYLNFTEAIWENSSKQSEFKAIIFALCFFHSVMCERRKFGPLGWSIPYEYNLGDIEASLLFLEKHLYAGPPSWSTVQYMVSEIQYGGKITDDLDRRLFNTFAELWLCPTAVSGGFDFNPKVEVEVESTRLFSGFFTS